MSTCRTLRQLLLFPAFLIVCAIVGIAQGVTEPIQTASERIAIDLPIGALLGISIDRDDEAVLHVAALSDHVEAVNGLEVSGGINFVDYDVIGVQVAGMANYMGRDLAGMQVAGGGNWVGGDASFIQASGILNYVGGGFTGIQAAGGANWVGTDASFIQASGILNYVGGGLTGIQATGGANWVGADASFMQASGIFNYAGGSLTGIQATGGANWVGMDASFIQASGIFNYVGGGLSGIQAAGGANWVGMDASFIQASGIFNYVGSVFTGIQVSGGLNWITGDASFLQVAGIANVSVGEFTGLQIASVNVANDVKGVQIGLLNMAATVVPGLQIGFISVGTQIGLINVRDRFEGPPIGLFNYAREGSLHTMIWTSEGIPIQVGVKSAFSESFYSLVGIGLTDTSRVSFDAITATCATGTHIPIGESFYLEADVGVQWSPITVGPMQSWGLCQGRAILGLEITDELSVFVGMARRAPLCEVLNSSEPTNTVFFGCQLF